MRTVRSFVFNLLGNFVPVLVALVCVPVIAQYAGIERLGALGVVWALVGYFGFLDLGLSRVVTRKVANAAQNGMLVEELTHLRSFFWRWMIPILLLIALLFMGAGFIFKSYLPSGIIGQEFFHAWTWIAWSIPIALATNWMRGMLEGLHRFGRVNLLRTVFGSWNYAVPAITVIYFPTLDAMIIGIVLGRALSLMTHIYVAIDAERGSVLGPTSWQTDGAKLFLTEGGWMTVSNLVGPLMVYFDRFLLAALQPARAVAWYITSQEVMLRTLVIPGALASVLFPQFSGAAKGTTISSQSDLYQRAIRVVAALMLPLCVLAAAGAYDGMRLWMGNSFALESYRLIAIIAIGIFSNSIAQLPFAWLQGTGHAKATAQLHIAELPLYALGLWVFVSEWGVVGAAYVWTFRVFLDCVALLHMASQRGQPGRQSILYAGVTIIALTGLSTTPDLAWEWRLSLIGGAVIFALAYAWFGLLQSDDRVALFRLRLTT